MQLKNCPNCGKRLPSEVKVCPDCGYIYKDNASISNNSNKKHLLPLTLLIFGLIISIIIIFLLTNRSISTSNEAIETPNKESITIVNNDITSPSPIPYAIPSVESPATLQPSTTNKDRSMQSNESLIGVYSGNDNSSLVLNEDGLAYYFYDSEYYELECPWEFDGHNVSIYLPKFHCTISASINESNPSNLMFISDSANWNPDLFVKTGADTAAYLKRTIIPNDKDITVLKNGTYSINLGDINIIVPSYYVDFKDEFDDLLGIGTFIDTNADTMYNGSIFFEVEDKTVESDRFNDEYASQIISPMLNNFCESATLNNIYKTSIADCNSYIADISGYLNKGFGALSGYSATGKAALINNYRSNSLIFLLFLATESNSDYGITDFENMLTNATILN